MLFSLIVILCTVSSIEINGIYKRSFVNLSNIALISLARSCGYIKGHRCLCQRPYTNMYV